MIERKVTGRGREIAGNIGDDAAIRIVDEFDKRLLNKVFRSGSASDDAFDKPPQPPVFGGIQSGNVDRAGAHLVQTRRGYMDLLDAVNPPDGCHAFTVRGTGSQILLQIQ
jgi:hypothetical protein